MDVIMIRCIPYNISKPIFHSEYHRQPVRSLVRPTARDPDNATDGLALPDGQLNNIWRENSGTYIAYSTIAGA